jgi:hypothetical protein
MNTDYFCIGRGLPIHWFCSAGDPIKNEQKRHVAHYWFVACNAKQVVQASARAARHNLSILGAQQHQNPLLLFKSLVLC